MPPPSAVIVVTVAPADVKICTCAAGIPEPVAASYTVPPTNPPWITVAHAENSDVLPEGSVAVAVTNWPGVSDTDRENATFPLPSVVTVNDATRFSPSPKPDASHVTFVNS